MNQDVRSTDQNSEEEWRDVPGYEGIYMASNRGSIKSMARIVICRNGATKSKPERIIGERIGKNGYARVSTRSRGVILVHQLIAKAFIDNPCGHLVINHIDGNKANNNVENLEWCTQSQNASHAHAIGLARGMILKKGEESIAAKLTEQQVKEIKVRLRHGETQRSIARIYGVRQTNICEINRGRSWSHVSV